MEAAPAPWYRSPALWFALPGLVFIVWAWMSSMRQRISLDLEIRGYSLTVDNEGSAISADWRETPPASSLIFSPPTSKTIGFRKHSRWPGATTEWFPLPSYFVNHTAYPTPWREVKVPHWFLLMFYLGLWQLP